MGVDESSRSSGELQAVILAAGLARRMRPLSDTRHKALLPIGGTTILGRIMDGLTSIGVDRVTVVTGYRADEVEGFLYSSYPELDLRLVKNAAYAETNNIVSLSLALDELSFDVDVVLVECDLLFDPSVLTRLVDKPGRNVALVDHYRAGMDGTVVTIRDGFVSEVFPTDVQGADFSYADKYKTLNIYRFDRDFCGGTLRPLLHTYAQEIDSSSYYELVLGMLSNIPAHRISAEVVDGERWVEVDDPNDLTGAAFQFEPDARAAILDRTFGGHWNFDVLDFSFMRNAYFPTGAMLAAMRHALPELVTNYGSTQAVLNEKLGYFLRCDPARVQLLHGASQAYPILGHLFGHDRAAIPTPTFGEYAQTFPNATRYVDAPGIDRGELERLSRGGRLVVIVNPNTPTGTTLPSAELHALARDNPQTRFWVDESFIAFSAEPSLVEILEEEPLDNAFVLTSLSKTLGVPGLRLGYLYSCNRELIEAVGRELPIWNLSAPAEFFLELLIKFMPAYERSLALTARDRDDLRRELGELPLVAQVHPSGGNFLLADLAGEDPALADRVRRRLLEEWSIEVKEVSGRFQEPSPRLRLALRAPQDNERLVEALRALGDER